MKNDLLEPAAPKPPTRLEPLQRLRTMGLPLAISLAIGMALLLTAISISLYFNSTFSAIDLSKPRYADVRADVLPEQKEDESFNASGPINRESVRAAIDELNKRRAELQKLSNFDNNALDDATLGLDPATAAQ